MCRGCCCGTAAKHPDVDHDAQLDWLRAALPAAGDRLWEVDCLGPCERSNVIVVRAGGGRRWFGDMLAPADTAAMARWIAAGAPDALPPALRRREMSPADSPIVVARRLDLHADAIAAMVHRSLADGEGSWTVGVPGAAAELWPQGQGHDQADDHAWRDGRTVGAVTGDGGLRMTIDDAVGAFALAGAGDRTVAVILGVPAGHGAQATPTTGLARHEGDPGSLRAADRAAVLVDLGLGRAGVRFCVRSADASLLAALRAVEGLGWRDVLDRVGPILVERSPHRVVESAIGRIEVWGRIPRPDEASPDGNHTHLLPGLLELGLDLPTGLALPPGFAPAATFYPPPGWTVPMA